MVRPRFFALPVIAWIDQAMLTVFKEDTAFKKVDGFQPVPKQSYV